MWHDYIFLKEDFEEAGFVVDPKKPLSSMTQRQRAPF